MRVYTRLVKCETREELYNEAQKLLREIQSTTQVELEALAEHDQTKLIAVDKKLEELIGQKERIFGALQQHTREHGC